LDIRHTGYDNLQTHDKFNIEKFMKTIGHRKIRPLALHASGELLAESARFNQAIHCLPTGETTFFPKGVYRYATHGEANRHWDECVARGMAECLKARVK